MMGRQKTNLQCFGWWIPKKMEEKTEEKIAFGVGIYVGCI